MTAMGQQADLGDAVRKPAMPPNVVGNRVTEPVTFSLALTFHIRSLGGTRVGPKKRGVGWGRVLCASTRHPSVSLTISPFQALHLLSLLYPMPAYLFAYVGARY